MIELRWMYHNFKTGAPIQGAIYVGDRLYQILEYRQLVPCVDASGAVSAFGRCGARQRLEIRSPIERGFSCESLGLKRE